MLKHITVHEYCHFKHKDNIWILVRNLCLILNWYNPFVWLAIDYVKRDCELACDESALELLGVAAHNEYGYTLISLLKCSNQGHHATIATTMSANMRRVKERITMIQTSKIYNAPITCIAIICIIFLTGCTFTQREISALSNLSNENTADSHELITSAVLVETLAESKEESSLSSSTEEYINTYYNITAKYYDGNTYVTSKDGLYKIKDGSKDYEVICDGRVTLGTIAQGYLFFYLYPKNMEQAAIMSFNLSNGELITALPLGTAIYSYMEMYGENGNLYVYKYKESEAVMYEIKEDGSLKEKGSLSFGIPENLQQSDVEIQPLSIVISKSEGYSDYFYMIKEKDDEFFNCLSIYKGNSLSKQVEDITDIMITSKGIICRDVNNYYDVYRYDVFTNEKQMLYQASEKKGQVFWL